MRVRLGGIAVAAAAALVAAAAFASPLWGEVTQKGDVRISVSGSMSPRRLPRSGSAGISVSVGARIHSLAAGSLPRLTSIAIDINRHGHLDLQGIPRCRLGHIVPSTTQEALAACGPALIGEGSFTSDVRIPEQSPFPSQGKVLAFNGRLRGRPAIFAHIYGTEPVPTSYVLPFSITRKHGTYGLSLEASLPQVTGEWGYVTGISLDLGVSRSRPGRKHAYLYAGCPAPSGFSTASFPLARTSFLFAGGTRLTSTLVRTCSVR